MRLRILAVGTRMPAWVEAAVHDYARRLPPELMLEVVEIPLGRRGKGTDPAAAIAAESQALLKAVGARDTLVALDVAGESWSTPRLAAQLAGWQAAGGNCCLLVGGPDGLDPACLQRAHARWSLSALTLPHPLVRVVLAEQLYRAWTINAGHPYHR
ncbi:MAG: 23S rRNA (pseudouridine(1915)-N(3))-methyltransferase RlmH [Gammaproteobacteria bacterium]|mgnify:FL=1|nr:23S rRNA (pseudouridine(1915)-N(3))-methyltransferase RlmH [Gammaproteobacteria bacterium]MBK9426309.1 23S rRNA (pseudouridine(1915)-N(3))-methyltransferase RlmH [Gammaproteobacteria bacterium]